MNRRTMVGAAAALLLVVQVGAVYAADPEDFGAALRDGNFSKAERALKSSARKWSVSEQQGAWWAVTNWDRLSSNAAFRGAQLLRQYGVSFGDWKVGQALRGKRSEEMIRFLIDIGMSLDGAVTYAIFNDYSDTLIQYLLDKNAEIDGVDLRRAAEKRKWKFVPQMIAKLSADDMSNRVTREEYTGDSYDPALSKTALMWAAQAGNFDIVRLLVEKGAKVNLRADDGATAASLAYDIGEIDIYNYLKEHGAVDYEPKQAAAAPAAPPSYSPANNYTPPSSYDSSSSSSSSSAPARNLGQEIAQSIQKAFESPLENGTYRMSGGAEKISFAGIAKSGSLFYTDAAGKQSRGTYSIDGDRITMNILGRSFFYTVTSKTSFSGNGESWFRSGF